MSAPPTMDSASVRLEHVRRLALAREPSHLEALASFLSDAEISVRVLAVRGLGWLRIPRAAPPISRCLSDPETAVRKWALASLSLSGCGLEIAHRIQAMVRTDDADSVRAAALRTLSWLGFHTAEPTIEWVLAHDEAACVLAAALEAVGRLELVSLHGPTRSYIDHPEARVRQHALRALSRFSSTPITNTLLKCAQDTDAETRAQVLRLLAGRDDPRSPFAPVANHASSPRPPSTQAAAA